jgi:bifunctional non-homologous end joining protein LigD
MAKATYVADLPVAIPKPMLASAMVTPLTGAAFDKAYGSGWVLEEKLDGHRCTAVVTAEGAVMAFSRPRAGEAAKPRALTPAIVAALSHLGEGVYDGELIVPGGKGWDVTRIGANQMLVVFDVLRLGDANVMTRPYAERRLLLLHELVKLPEGQTAVTTVMSEPVSWAAVQAIWARGGEGAILKKVTSTYRPGARSPEWIKVKQVNTAVLPIIGFEAGKMGPYSKVLLRLPNGLETSAKSLDNATRADMAKNPSKYLGARLVVTYQMVTPDGKLRHVMWDHLSGEGE